MLKVGAGQDAGDLGAESRIGEKKEGGQKWERERLASMPLKKQRKRIPMSHNRFTRRVGGKS